MFRETSVFYLFFFFLVARVALQQYIKQGTNRVPPSFSLVDHTRKGETAPLPAV